MTAFLLGALGAVLVVAPLCIGAIIGWKAHTAYTRHLESMRPAVPEPAPQHTPTAEEIQRFKEDQEAFETMLHYSPEMAYGITGDKLKDLERKET